MELTKAITNTKLTSSPVGNNTLFHWLSLALWSEEQEEMSNQLHDYFNKLNDHFIFDRKNKISYLIALFAITRAERKIQLSKYEKIVVENTLAQYIKNKNLFDGDFSVKCISLIESSTDYTTQKTIFFESQESLHTAKNILNIEGSNTEHLAPLNNPSSNNNSIPLVKAVIMFEILKFLTDKNNDSSNFDNNKYDFDSHKQDFSHDSFSLSNDEPDSITDSTDLSSDSSDS